MNISKFMDGAAASIDKGKDAVAIQTSKEIFNTIIPFLNGFDIDISYAFNQWNKCQLKYFYKKTLKNEIQYVADSIMYGHDVEEHDVSEQLKWLKSLPQHEQKTPEWYEFRSKVITASSLWKIFGTDATRNELMKDKIDPSTFNAGKAIDHGNRFEVTAQKIFETITNTTITEYGCIKHKNIDHIGASPDGIVTDSSGDQTLIGRMLEIKCPYSRQLHGIPKYDYWVQVQIQLEVCDLEYCDFFECDIKEYSTYEDYVLGVKKNNFEFSGIILESKNGETTNRIYSDLNLSLEEVNDWYSTNIEDILKTESNDVNFIGWGLRKYSRITIKRNREWFFTMKDVISKYWDTLLKKKEEFKNNPNMFKKMENKKSKQNKKQTHVCLLEDSDDEELICVPKSKPDDVNEQTHVCLLEDSDLSQSII